MAIKTQGTEIFVLVGDPNDLNKKMAVEIECPVDFDPGDDTPDEIEVTCLSERDSKSFIDGLITPGKGSLLVNIDSKNSSHRLLYNLSKSKSIVKWAIGLSDGETKATVNSAGTDFELSSDRTWLTFNASVGAFPFDFTANNVVKTNCPLTRFGRGELIWKEDEAEGEGAEGEGAED